MKAANFVAVILLAGSGYAIYEKSQEPPPASHTAPAVVPAPVAKAEVKTEQPLPVKTQWRRDELTVLHGVIVQRKANGVMVQATASEDGGVWQVHLGPGAESATPTKRATGADLQKYGPVITPEGGRLHPAEKIPAQHIGGFVLLTGYDGDPGQPVNLVVAPLTPEAYTANFRVLPPPTGLWMYEDRGALDPKPHK